jgi:hypothetical protein
MARGLLGKGDAITATGSLLRTDLKGIAGRAMAVWPDRNGNARVAIPGGASRSVSTG